jgi:hypothetical protein
MLIPTRCGQLARLGDVPSDIARVLWVGVVGAGLTVDGDAPERHDEDVDDEGEQRDPEVHDEEDDFDEQDEHGYYGDDHVVVCYACSR